MTSKNLVLFVLTLLVTAACGGGGGGSNFTGVPTPNVAPIVSAGMDATIRLPDNMVSLDGTVSDDGLPAGGAVSTSWIVQSGPDGAVFADVNAVDTTITFINEGTYELQLTANDTQLQTSDSITVIVEAAPALSTIAVTPANTSLFTNATQTFSASGTDQYGAAFPTNVTWSATGGTINQAGEYVAGTTLGVFDVTATDGAVSGTAGVTVTDSPPTADAGGPYAGAEGSVVAVDGSASSDPNDDIVSYEWDLDNDGAYDDAVGVSTNYMATASGVFTIGLQVTDSEGAMATDTAEVTVTNIAPTAVAGGPYSGNQAATIVLDGSASSDPGNDIVSYEWDLDNDGAYDDATGAMTNFVSNDVGTFTVGLKVTDGDTASDTATASVTVANVAPTANAGPDQPGVLQGATVTLDGSGSSDAGGDTLTYAWTLTSIPAGSTAALSSATVVAPTFDTDKVGSYVAELVVNDGTVDSVADSVTITVANVAPVADAGPDQPGVVEGATVTLDGSGSTDPGGDTLTYAWTLTTKPAGSAAALSSATVVGPTFDTDIAGLYVAELLVNDGTVDSAADTVTVTVANVTPTANAGGPYTVDQGENVSLDGSASADTGGSIVSWEWDTNNDGSYGDLVGVNPTLPTGLAGTFTIGLRVTDDDGDTATTTTTLTVNDIGLVAYWWFNENAGTTTVDLTGSSNGTLVGAGWGAGVSGSAADFDGVDDYVSIDNTPALNVTGSAITLSAWIYPTQGNVVNGSRIISKRTDAGGTEVYAMILDQYRLNFRLDGVDMVGPIVRLNDWTHVTMVYDGTDKRIYINGVLDATPPQAKADAIDASTRAVQLGWRESEARHYRGRLDEAQIYDVALTPAQVAALYARDTAPPTPAGLYFSDITVASGTSGFTNSGHAVAFAEVDNDSLPDLYVTNVGLGGTDRELFYRNTDGATFTEEAAARNIDDVDGGSIGAVFADLDNDGDYDLFNGGVWPVSPQGTGNPENDNVYRNEGLGVFTDVTGAVGPDIANTKIETGGVTALDWDADGDLDLIGVPGGALNEPIEAFVNNGNFTFSTWIGGGDLATAIADEGVIATDYDGDGDVDILVGNQVGDFVILDNNGAGFFTQIVPATLGITIPSFVDGVTTADIDNDGDLDLLLVSDGTGVLYRRAGVNYDLLQVFADIEGKMGGFADLNNDNFLDLIFAGDERIFENGGSGMNPFYASQSVPVAEIVDPLSIAFADIEGDGDLDFAISAPLSRNYLIRNDLDGNGNNYLKVELAWGATTGQCQAGAFGAKTRVFEAGTTNLVGLRESTGNRGFIAQDDPVLHFGLGPRATVDVEVTWIDGTTTTQAGVAANQRILIDACP